MHNPLKIKGIGLDSYLTGIRGRVFPNESGLSGSAVSEVEFLFDWYPRHGGQDVVNYWKSTTCLFDGYLTETSLWNSARSSPPETKPAHKPPERDTPRRHGDDFQWQQAKGNHPPNARFVNAENGTTKAMPGFPAKASAVRMARAVGFSRYFRRSAVAMRPKMESAGRPGGPRSGQESLRPDAWHHRQAMRPLSGSPTNKHTLF